MAIVNGQTASADDVMNAFGNMFYDTARLVWSTGVGATTLKNVGYSKEAGMNITGNIVYDSTNKWYWGPTDVVEAEYTVYDDCDDSSVDAGNWTVVTNTANSGTATVTENDTYQQCFAQSALIVSSTGTATSTSVDLLTDNGQFVMVTINEIHAAVSGTGGDTTASAQIKLGDTVITSVAAQDGGTETDTKTGYKLQIFRIGNINYYRLYNGATWGSWTIVASTVLSHTCTCNLTASGSSATSHTRISNVRYNTLVTAKAATTNYLTSATTTSSATVTNSISTYNTSILSGSTEVKEISYNNGSNYEEFTDGQIQRNTNTGSQIINKWILKGAGTFSSWATKYNLY